MLETSDRLRARLTTSCAVSRALARPLDELSVVRAVHAELARVMDVTICFFGRYDAAGQTVEVVWQFHDGEELPGGHFPLGDGPTSQAIRQAQPQLIRNLSRDLRSVQVQYATQQPSLPESMMVVPIVFDSAVIGVLSVQSYLPAAYDDEDVALLQSVADQMAVALVGAHDGAATDAPARASELEAIVASMPDALVVLDREGRVVRLNQAARRLLSRMHGGLVFGQPVDRPQYGDLWPLGSRKLTDQLRPVVDQLRHGAAPDVEIQLTLNGRSHQSVRGKASLLMKDDDMAGAVILLRESS